MLKGRLEILRSRIVSLRSREQVYSLRELPPVLTAAPWSRLKNFSSCSRSVMHQRMSFKTTPFDDEKDYVVLNDSIGRGRNISSTFSQSWNTNTIRVLKQDDDEISNTTNYSIRVPGVNRGMKVINELIYSRGSKLCCENFSVQSKGKQHCKGNSPTSMRRNPRIVSRIVCKDIVYMIGYSTEKNAIQSIL